MSYLNGILNVLSENSTRQGHQDNRPGQQNMKINGDNGDVRNFVFYITLLEKLEPLEVLFCPIYGTLSDIKNL